MWQKFNGSLNLTFHILRRSEQGWELLKESWTDWLNEVKVILSGDQALFSSWMMNRLWKARMTGVLKDLGLQTSGRESRYSGAWLGPPSYADKKRMRYEWGCPCGRKLGTGTRMPGGDVQVFPLPDWKLPLLWTKCMCLHQIPGPKLCP